MSNIVDHIEALRRDAWAEYLSKLAVLDRLEAEAKASRAFVSDFGHLAARAAEQNVSQPPPIPMGHEGSQPLPEDDEDARWAQHMAEKRDQWGRG